jgi:pimeloyl-ACP methyl ester carboxylesterase
MPDMPSEAAAGEAAHLRWWECLPEDFHRQADGTELDREYWLQVRGTAALDRAMRSVLSLLVVSAFGPVMLSSRRWMRDLAWLEFHEELAVAADSRRSFPPPPSGVRVQQLNPRLLGYRPPGIPSRLLRFDSPFQTLHPDLRRSYARHTDNARAFAQHWYHQAGPRPTLVLIHGFFADPYWFNAQMFSLRWFYEHGYDILLYTLPFHGERAGDSWVSGYRLFSQGVAHFNEAMLQAVHDLRIFIDHLQAEGVEHVGLTGLSLGGYTAALMAGVDPRIAFCIPNSPAVSPMDFLREWRPSNLLIAHMQRRTGMSMAEARRLIAIHNPLTYAPRIDTGRCMVIGGAGDRFTPPRHVRLLHRHWPGSAMLWFPGNHLLHLRQGEYLRRMKQFMDRHTGGPPPAMDDRISRP